ncbi:hypothetical protein SDRG_10187 [Saprolegnia diclina VS20]|uniref:Uncharacterized protein n=1 Tax=Saprolegnia diclina (strain VS20) TaxID=1156394 RepID=T0RPT6_SAPDV|nr:hypothetical protein SDRG_10187 [Saprolegnia diclina VS20]EQC31987.1 hypothetical protein SDRG_10187 [Saprolegnia diclina VS20]|eukprot:XP_008614389.1 hypothetical protein SDRG_10187 [Saprolegnia diclina VS20]
MPRTHSARESAGVVLFDASDTRWSGVCTTTRTSIMLDLSYLYDPISPKHDAKAASTDATTKSATDTTCSSTTESLGSRRHRRRTTSVVETHRPHDAKWFTPVSKFFRSLFRPRDRDSLLLPVQRPSKYYK